MKPLLLLDLDTTLLKTYVFWQDFLDVFVLSSGLSKNRYLRSNMQKDAHLRDSIDYELLITDFNYSNNVIKNKVMQIMRLKSYLFDDARSFLEHLQNLSSSFDVAILTYGQNHFQQLKINHTPELLRIKTYITRQSKSEYIKENFSERPRGVLIDDKPDQKLPDNWIEIHIDRSQKVYNTPVKVRKNCWRITNLKDILRIAQ
jgi:hypothetical protein